MNTILRLFLCTALLASPLVATTPNEQPTSVWGIWLKSYVHGYWKLGAATVSGTIAAFSGLLTLGHMLEPLIVIAEESKRSDILRAAAALCNELKQSPPFELVVIELKQVQISNMIVKEAIKAHQIPRNFWLVVFTVSSIAALLLYDSWYTDSITKHTMDGAKNSMNEKETNESCAPFLEIS